MVELQVPIAFFYIPDRISSKFQDKQQADTRIYYSHPDMHAGKQSLWNVNMIKRN